MLQVRLDETLKNDAIKIFETLGLDISSAVRMFLKRSILERGIPFKLTIPDEPYKAERGYQAMLKMQEISEQNGNSNMTLDEINDEINQARQERAQIL